jgi:MFS family permease
VTTGSSDASPLLVAAAAMVALAVAMGVGRFAFTPILPMMQDDVGLSVAAGGWLASANYLGYLVGAWSAITLRMKPATVIRGSLLVIALTTFAMALTGHYAAWLVLRALAGMASAWVLVFVSAWSMEQLAQRPGLNGVVFAGVGAGIFIAGAVALVLMHANTGSDSAWETLGMLSLLLALLVWPAFARTTSTARQSAAVPDNTPRDAAWTWLIVCYGLFGFGYIIPATFLPAMAKQVITDPAIFGWSWPVFGAAAIVSTLLAAALPRRRGNRRRLWATGHMLMALGVAIPVFQPGIVAIVVAALLVGGTFMVVTMVAIQEAREVAGTQARRLIAAMTATFAGGQIVGPVVAGYAAALWGNFSVALLAASVLLAASAWTLWPAPDAA